MMYSARNRNIEYNAAPAMPVRGMPFRVLQGNSSADIVILKGPFQLLLGIVAISWVVPALNPVIYLLLAYHASKGARQTIEAFTVLSMVLLGHPVLFPVSAKSLRWLVLFAGFGRILYDLVIQDTRMRFPGMVLGLLGVFTLSTLVTAFTISRLPLLSALKVVSFSVGVFTIFVSFYNTLELKNYWKSWFYTHFVFVFIASLMIMAAGLGYNRTREGLQGIYLHPQSMGPIMAMMTAWLTGEYILYKKKPALFLVAILVGWTLVFLSGARTAAVAAVVGAGVAFLFFLLQERRRVPLARFFLNPLSALLFLATSITMVSFPSQVIGVFTDFVQKGDEVSSAGEIFQQSRGEALQKSFDNFKESPLFGIGFGVPSDLGESLSGRTDTAMGIPISASYEKGFMPAAILEEVGLVGSMMVLFIVIILAMSIHRYGEISIIWMFWTSLLINIGESVFFSVGALGFIMWLFIGYCYCHAESNRLQTNEARYPTHPTAILN